jgi:hypothetical protein
LDANDFKEGTHGLVVDLVGEDAQGERLVDSLVVAGEQLEQTFSMAAHQTRVFVGGPVIPAGTPATPAPIRIGIAFDPHLRLPQFDVDRARLWFREVGGPMLPPAEAPANSREVSISTPIGLLSDMSASAE